MPDLERVPLVMSDIPGDPMSQERRGWQLEINGERYGGVLQRATLVNDHMGVSVTLAQRPEGYDAPVIVEPGGGGAVTAPFMLHPERGQIYLGIVEEDRKGQGGLVRNIPRGFLAPGETHEEGAVREIRQETGLDVLAKRLILLSSGINPNSAFFDTSQTLPSGEPAGVRIFGLPVRIDELEELIEPDGSLGYVFPATIRRQAEGVKVHERILGSQFVPMGEALESGDMFTLAAAGALWRHLALGSNSLYGAGVTPSRSIRTEENR